MGNEIVIPRDPRATYSLVYGALDQYGTTIYDGNWTVTTEGGQSVSSGQKIYEDFSVLLNYTPPKGYKLIRWEGTLPPEKAIVGESLKLPITAEWEANAIVSSLAPPASELGDTFTIRFDNLENNATDDDFIFTIESNATSETTEGEMTVGENLRGNFTYSLSGPDSVSIIVTEFESNVDQNSTWDQWKGGGFALELTVSNFQDLNELGSFIQYYNDGTVDMGTWESSGGMRSSRLTFEGIIHP